MTILHKLQNTDTRTKTIKVSVLCALVRVQLWEYDAEKLFKHQQRKIRWSASGLGWLAVNHGKGYANRKPFLVLTTSIPILQSSRKWKHFLCCGFQSFRTKTASIVLWWGALLICQSKTLWRTFGWPQPTLLIQETVYHMSPKSSAIDSSEIASAVTVTLTAVSVIPGSSICLDICVHIYFWLKNPCHTDRKGQRGLLLRTGRLEVDF